MRTSASGQNAPTISPQPPKRRAGEGHAEEDGVMMIDSCIAHDLIRHAMREAPNECCGLVFHKGFVGLTNTAEHPDREFLIAHEEYLATCMRQDAKPLAIYHSHPTGQPTPSVKDCQLMDAFEVCNLDIAMVIVGLHPPMVRVFKKQGNVYKKVEEVTLTQEEHPL
jgi:proteasome lid subunit RPN8/RPN11